MSEACTGCDVALPEEPKHSDVNGLPFCDPCWAAMQAEWAGCTHTWHSADYTEVGEHTQVCDNCGLIISITEGEHAALLAAESASLNAAASWRLPLERIRDAAIAVARSEVGVMDMKAGAGKVYDPWPAMDELVAVLDQVAPGWQVPT